MELCRKVISAEKETTEWKGKALRERDEAFEERAVRRDRVYKGWRPSMRRDRPDWHGGDRENDKRHCGGRW